ncbi:transcriptional regulator with XRE-family HTH domain [Flavobacterium sp. 2755]|uniref:helix-turn-helix domain-containing protein n=1 Tax=Flavobacterium sp. 2755 TaxID=2817765 RepID=UPI00285F853B|nr:helix-turn-helix transcriptional regulator [Flavobacterium sp. 2755]MDR6760278.1 transcriptional regulator with XRE-family HTH domain [Flavobacterium sp. 2755]
MNFIGKKISETRKIKGFTQEELAELSKVNLRTIQRIENSNNEPRGKTLDLICEVLQIDKADLQDLNKVPQNNRIVAFIVNGIFLILLNLAIMLTIVYLAAFPESNINSRLGGVLLSFFIPFTIFYYTQKIKATERIFKFGICWIIYLPSLLYAQGFRDACAIGFRTWIFSCILLYFGVLFYGKVLFKSEKK